jgi:hypothetical protein
MAHKTGKPPFVVPAYPHPEATVNEPPVLPKPLEKLEADFMAVVVIAVIPLVAELEPPSPPNVVDSEGLLVLFQ